MGSFTSVMRTVTSGEMKWYYACHLTRASFDRHQLSICRESQLLVPISPRGKCCAVQYFGFLSMDLCMALSGIQTIFIPESDFWSGIHHLLNIKSAVFFLKSNIVSADLNILTWPRGKEKQRQDEKTIILCILLNINDFSKVFKLLKTKSEIELSHGWEMTQVKKK